MSRKKCRLKDSKRNRVSQELGYQIQCVTIIINQTRLTTALDIGNQAKIARVIQARTILALVHLAMIRAAQVIHQVVAATKLTKPKLC